MKPITRKLIRASASPFHKLSAVFYRIELRLLQLANKR